MRRREFCKLMGSAGAAAAGASSLRGTGVADATEAASDSKTTTKAHCVARKTRFINTAPECAAPLALAIRPSAHDRLVSFTGLPDCCTIRCRTLPTVPTLHGQWVRVAPSVDVSN